jgi:hypothetical protein
MSSILSVLTIQRPLGLTLYSVYSFHCRVCLCLFVSMLYTFLLSALAQTDISETFCHRFNICNPKRAQVRTARPIATCELNPQMTKASHATTSCVKRFSTALQSLQQPWWRNFAKGQEKERAPNPLAKSRVTRMKDF